MMTIGQFQSQTDYDSDSNAGAVVRGVLKRNRGSNLAVIDAALSSYWLVLPGADPTAIAAALERVIVACQWWLKLKQSKIGVKTETTNTDTRASVINTLKSQAITELRNRSASRAEFALNKANAIDSGVVKLEPKKNLLSKKSEATGMVNLAPGYEHERRSYEDSKKQRAISASAVYASNEGNHNISYKDYQRIYKELTKQGATDDLLVSYLPKEDRLAYLLVCINGVFSYANGAYPKSSITSGQPEPYAIDRYGNFFSTQLGTRSTKGQIFNHSCFTAGTPVLCAGMCQFDANGRIHHIDNDSGHYKPNRNALWGAVNLLINWGVNGVELRVKVKDAHGQTQVFRGSTFAAAVNAAPDWNVGDNAQFGLV